MHNKYKVIAYISTYRFKHININIHINMTYIIYKYII